MYGITSYSMPPKANAAHARPEYQGAKGKTGQGLTTQKTFQTRLLT